MSLLNKYARLIQKLLTIVGVATGLCLWFLGETTRKAAIEGATKGFSKGLGWQAPPEVATVVGLFAVVGALGVLGHKAGGWLGKWLFDEESFDADSKVRAAIANLGHADREVRREAALTVAATTAPLSGLQNIKLRLQALKGLKPLLGDPDPTVQEAAQLALLQITKHRD